MAVGQSCSATAAIRVDRSMDGGGDIHRGDRQTTMSCNQLQWMEDSPRHARRTFHLRAVGQCGWRIERLIDSESSICRDGVQQMVSCLHPVEVPPLQSEPTQADRIGQSRQSDPAQADPEPGSRLPALRAVQVSPATHAAGSGVISPALKALRFTPPPTMHGTGLLFRAPTCPANRSRPARLWRRAGRAYHA
jgi:hypothetical protein